ncbi:hypothetical protein F3Y22_tig00110472pilonHSYRG00120 [Hibiscus syriacus]|uniref:RNase H type-1 domain-containing protein n=1 Tax=Hibiscus syriacus TaxID=106335 RepID=A0A6A3AK12_HIBSY|nr:hypothetical protein F3Y22_tig00110472pilonHSYRG00120 [Hibiscus syriacus]
MEGLTVAWSQGYEIIPVQSDCAPAIRMLQDPTAANSSLSLVRAIVGLCNRAWVVDFKWIPMESNFPVDAHAKLSSRSPSCSLVMHNTPLHSIHTLLDRDKFDPPYCRTMPL